MTSESGTRIGHETFDSIPASAKLRPLHDKLIVEPIPWPFSDIIEVVYDGRPMRGKVRAVGPGHYRKIYNGPKGKRTKSWDSKYFTPCDVKVGDVVQLGGMEIRGYLFQTFRWGNKEMVVCRENDVTAIEVSNG
jgi:co-chaperonin GroES (HSP10)